MLQHGSGQSMASCHLRSHVTSLAAPRPGLATSEPPARGSGLETRVPPVRSSAGRCGLPEIGRLGAVTYRARQDRAGIVRSRKLQWARHSGQGEDSVAAKVSGRCPVCRSEAGSRAARQPSVTQSDASDSGPGPRLPGSRNTAGAGAGHGSRHWQLAWKLSWLLTATVLLSAFTWYRTWAGSMAHWLHWTTVTKSPSARGLLVLIFLCY